MQDALRCHPPDRHLPVGRPLVQVAGVNVAAQPEVRYLDVLRLVQQDVPGRQVPVDDLVLVQVFLRKQRKK